MLMKKLKPSEILKCMDFCGNALTCTTDNHACAYGDEGCIDCVDRLEADIQALIDAGDNLILLRTAPENKAAEKPRCDRCEHCTHAPSQKADGFTYYCDLSGRDVGQSHFGHNSPRVCPMRTPENKPLTLEKLRKMVDSGEWVWVEMNFGTVGWCKLFQKHPLSMKTVDGGHITELDFIRGFVVGAYARKPEQETRHE